MKNKKDGGIIRDASVEENLHRRGKLSSVVPKILCVIAAFILWIYVMMVESPEYEKTIGGFTVQIENASALESNSNLSILNVENGTVSLTLSGKKSVIDRIDTDDIRVAADVSRVDREGRNSLDLFVSLPDGVALVETNPKSVIVYAAETAVVSAPVKANTSQLKLESPYELGRIEPEYDSITVTGPREIVSQVSYAQVSVDVTNMTSSFVQSCSVQLCDKDGTIINQPYVKLSETEMQVKVNINFTRNISVETELKYGFISDSLISVKTDPKNITVRGDGALLSSSAILMEPIVIDEKSIPANENKYTFTVNPVFADGVTSSDGVDSVSVTVELDSSVGKKNFVVENIKPVGASDSLKYEILDESKNVTLRGRSDILADIKDSDISIEVDLSGYGKTDSKASSNIVNCPAKIIVSSRDADEIFEAGTYTVRVKIDNE